jgi:hypothetical protein
LIIVIMGLGWFVTLLAIESGVARWRDQKLSKRIDELEAREPRKENSA